MIFQKKIVFIGEAYKQNGLFLETDKISLEIHENSTNLIENISFGCIFGMSNSIAVKDNCILF